MSSTEAIVRTEGLGKDFGETRALDALDLEIDAGKVLGLLGHNGAGKTTAVRILSTLLRPDRGRARVDGVDVQHDPAGVRERVTLAGQQATLDERLTGKENLVLLGRLQQLGLTEARRRADVLLDRFDLASAANRQTKTYSGGMRRRLDLAACLMVPRPVVFLDEPTTGLDPLGRTGMWSAIRGMADEGAAVLLTTQYLEEADQLADSIVVLAEGRKVAEGTPNQVKALAGGHRVEVTFADGPDLDAAVRSLNGRAALAEIDRRSRTVSLPAPGAAQDLRAVLRELDEAGVPVEEASVRRPSLDDAFFALAGDGREHPDATTSEIEPIDDAFTKESA